MNISDFTLSDQKTIADALKKIDANGKGFLLIINKFNELIGTLTDGDLRRAFINGVTIRDKIERTVNKDFCRINITDEFKKAIELFKDSKIEFLPIVNQSNQLVNVITKKNMHVLLLSDIEFDWYYNFSKLEDTLLEHEIYDRPWGFYKTTFLNNYSQSKILNVKPLKELSLQEHKRREEYWVVITGVGEIILGDSIKRIEAGSFVFIPKSCKHKLKNLSHSEALMIAEVQLGDYFGEDDIQRYDDVY